MKKYPRKCKGKRGPHIIRGPEDEILNGKGRRICLACWRLKQAAKRVRSKEEALAQQFLPGRYPRYCRGRNGPHLIQSIEDECLGTDRGGYHLLCKVCRRASLTRIQAKYREDPLVYVRALQHNNKLARKKAERRQEDKLRRIR